MSDRLRFRFLPKMVRAALFLGLIGIARLGVRGEAAGGARENRIVLDLPPGPNNPRNSEGAFLDLKGGGLLFVYSRFIGSDANDYGSACLAARTSVDGGETWSKTDRIIARPGAGVLNLMSVSLLRMRNGDIGLFYLERRGWQDMRMRLRRSADEGRTWGSPTDCMPKAGYYVVNNDRVVRLASGRLVIPASWHPGRPGASRPSDVDWRGIAVFFLSDDDGATWRDAGGRYALHDARTKVGLQEPGIVELADGTLWGWARTDLGCQYEFFSRDGGVSWTPPEPSRFTSPVSPLSMKRIPGGERLLAVWNPAPADGRPAGDRFNGGRTPLVFAIGEGPASGWSRPVPIEGGDRRDAGYAYTAIHLSGHALLLAYCAGGREDGAMLNRLRIRKLGEGYYSPAP